MKKQNKAYRQSARLDENTKELRTIELEAD
jgi:hypothetical protein